KSFLKDKVSYSASDSMLIDQVNQKAYLYNNAVVVYDGLNLKAGYIEIDFAKNMVYATVMKDSAGKYVQKPVFEQGEDKFTAEKITYNFNTKKGKIVDVITQQGEGFIHGRDIKKDTNNVYYVGHGKYTTCDLEHPHFYIGAKKIKVIPNDKIITGPAVLYIADIPTPLAIPFGFFPNKKGRASGILLPTYGESTNMGFFLKDGGFYFGMNENVDLALRGDVFSNGGYGLKANSSYRKRYRYNGGLSVNYSRFIEGDKEIPNSKTRNDFFVRWSHTQDPKSKPNSRFSANVNAGSSSYNKYNGSVNGDYLSNTFQSNISYSKTFQGTPFNFSASARHSQNTISKKVDISLPELALNMNRIYPFKNNKHVGNRWYDKIGLSASANARNDINSYDTLLFTNRTVQQMRNGVRFTVPISTSFNVLKYFTFTPTINTASNIYFETIQKHYDQNINHVFTDTITGVKMANDFSVSSGLSTRLYGDYFFRTKRLKQIRHVATPTISASYRPDFSEKGYGYYKKVQSDSIGTEQEYSIFQNGIYGTPLSGKSGLIGFSLNNSLEAKIREKTDSGNVDKKVKLLESFNIGFSYNLAAKNYNWSAININGRTKLFNVLDINASASLDPYQIDSVGNRIEKYEWKNGKAGRITSSNLSMSTNLRSKEGDGSKPKSSIAGTQDELDYINSHQDAYVDFNVPWNLNMYYNINYSKPGIKETVSQSVTFNGDVSLTKKWKISLSSGYDFTRKEMTLTSVNVYRDLHCWEMRFNWVPFGFRQSFSIDINVKSSILKDLKLSRRKGWEDYQ
ncbi:MAG: putative LPS assembly protein LptD, partial [Bacteroidetes bacterium]|nr:putative LPS assembly protein LptD [Bacteroidota bacterium]